MGASVIKYGMKPEENITSFYKLKLCTRVNIIDFFNNVKKKKKKNMAIKASRKITSQHMSI